MLWDGLHIDIEYGSESIGPIRRGMFALEHTVQHAFEHGLHLTVVIAFLPGQKPAIHLLWHDPRQAYGPQNIVSQAPLPKIGLALSQDIVSRLVLINSPHSKHLRQIMLSLAHTKQFRLQKGSRGKAPAGTRPVLAFDTGMAAIFIHRKFILGG